MNNESLIEIDEIFVDIPEHLIPKHPDVVRPQQGA